MNADDFVTYEGRRYRLVHGRILLNWAQPPRPMLHHRTGCILCCDVRVTTGPGSPPRHPANCSNCMTYRGPRPDPCRYCGVTAHFRDGNGHPVHKVCLEQAITAAALAADGDDRLTA